MFRPVEPRGAIGEDSNVGVTDEHLSWMQAQRIRRKPSTLAEVLHDLIYPAIIPGDCIFARYVPLDLLGQQSAHGIHRATRVHGVLRVVQSVED